jgi:hypothetical protein
VRALFLTCKIGQAGGLFSNFIKWIEELGEENVKWESWSVIVRAVRVSGLKVS